MTKGPSPTGSNGRDPRGRFAPGNKSAKGNPFAKKAQRLRSALLRAVKPGDVEAVIGKLVRLAKRGDVQAAKLLLDRVLGPPVPADVFAEIDALRNEVETLIGDRIR